MSYISRKLLWSALVVAGLMSPSVMALAADYGRPLAGRAIPYAPPPLQHRWDGLYVGINGGGMFGSANWSLAGDSFNTAGWMVGATLGYNVQLGGFVAGLEGDFNYVSGGGTTTVGGCAAGCSLEQNYLATARGRIGYALDRFLPYVTGGLAVGQIDVTQTGVGTSSPWRYGYTVGAGLEMAVMPSWTVKGEYLFVDLGTYTCTPVCGVAPTNAVGYYTNVWRLGLNYRF